MSTINKYRPTLPAHLIAHIMELAKLETPLSQDSAELIGILAPFKAKIDNGAKVPVYTTAPAKPSLEESLGMIGIVEAKGAIPKEEYWKQCYIAWVEAPTACSLAEIQGAQEHRYLEGLMAPDEVIAFERQDMKAPTPTPTPTKEVST